jgi:hypothetical protein
MDMANRGRVCSGRRMTGLAACIVCTSLVVIFSFILPSPAVADDGDIGGSFMVGTPVTTRTTTVVVIPPPITVTQTQPVETITYTQPPVTTTSPMTLQQTTHVTVTEVLPPITTTSTIPPNTLILTTVVDSGTEINIDWIVAAYATILAALVIVLVIYILIGGKKQ